MSKQCKPIDEKVPMRYRDLVPSFRCARHEGEIVVEVPPGYEGMPNGRPTTDDGPDIEAHKALVHLGDLRMSLFNR